MESSCDEINVDGSEELDFMPCTKKQKCELHYIELNRECLYDRDVCGIMCLPRNGWDIW